MRTDTSGITGLVLLHAEKLPGSQAPDGLDLAGYTTDDLGNAAAIATLMRFPRQSKIEAVATSIAGIWKLYDANPGSPEHPLWLPEGNSRLLVGYYIVALNKRAIDFLKEQAMTYCGSEYVYISFKPME